MNNTQKYAVTILASIILVGSVHPMERNDVAVQDDHAQEKEFHARLQRIHPECFQDEVQFFYKKIMPITSTPPAQEDRWEAYEVSISGERIRPDANGIYRYGNLSFSINFPAQLDSNQPFDVEVVCNDESKQVRFKKSDEKKVTLAPRFTSYHDVIEGMRNNRVSAKHLVNWQGILDSEETSAVIKIKSQNRRKYPVTLQGLEVLCNKDNKETKIFLDFMDNTHESVSCKCIKCKHGSLECDQTIFCIKQHQVYDCNGKTIYGFFDSPQVRAQWIENETGFYDLTKAEITTLPSCYADPDDTSETPREPVTWVFGDDHESFYKLDGPEVLQESNDYIYHKDNDWFVMLPYKAKFKECLSNDHKKEFSYVVQVAEPSMRLHRDAIIQEGVDICPSGLYERIRLEDSSRWVNVEEPERAISFDGKEVPMDANFPAQGLTAKNAIKFCDAAQRFFFNFKGVIRHCNQNVINRVVTWNKLTHLDLANLCKGGRSKWRDLLSAVGSMTQLTHLNFSNNHPITSFFEKPFYSDFADPASEYYRAVGDCLRRLPNLKELHIQGLWAKPSSQLGPGCHQNKTVSTEVAILTGIINHNKQVGIRSIINSICGLRNLENLSLDGIPNEGSSDFARKTMAQQVFLSPFWLLVSPIQGYDGHQQGEALKQLVRTSTDQIVRLSTLKTVLVYSPGGNCTDYFSKEFREKLIAARRNTVPALPSLEVIAKELQ